MKTIKDNHQALHSDQPAVTGLAAKGAAVWNHLGLFEGIGGFSLAARWMGWKTVAWCEIEPYCQKILKKNFPEAQGYGDIKKTDFIKYENKINILTGGFPCQPFSIAGKRKGSEDERSLWFEMYRAIKQIKPPFIVAENVPGLITIESGIIFEGICSDLENIGYEVQAFIIPACGKDAPHKRERLWILAYSDKFRCDNEQKGFDKTCQDKERKLPAEKQSGEYEQCRISESGISSIPADTTKERLQRRKYEAKGKLQGQPGRLDRKFTIPEWGNFPTSPALCGRVDGISHRVDRIKALGNAIVPQVAYELFKCINICMTKTANK